MYVLIDYSNIKSSITNKGIEYLTEKLISIIVNTEVFKLSDVFFRIYGGWHSGEKQTLSAKNLIADLDKDFPKYRRLNVHSSIKVHVELAYSLINHPKIFFLNTYRQKQIQRNVRCLSADELGCCHDGCPMDIIRTYIETKKCPVCNKNLDNFMFRNEQKIVDSLIICDLLLILQNNESNSTMIVSSDDDFIPAIYLCLMNRHHVYHVLTQINHQKMINVSSFGPYSQYYHPSHLI